jgi:hypothetical protein
MSDTVWISDFIDAFGEDPLILPDGEVRNSSHADWQPVLDVLHASGWTMAMNGASRGSQVPSEVARLMATEELPSFSVVPVSGVTLNFFCSRKGPVLFDIDLREMISQGALDGICDAMRLIGTSTRKDVALAPGGLQIDVLTFDSSTASFALHR